MSQWHKKSRCSDPPNEQNYSYLNVPVDNGTIRAKRYGCAGCKKQLPEKEVNFLLRSDSLKAAVATRWGSFYVYTSGSAYPSDNKSWPYCDGCFAELKAEFFSHKLAMKAVEENGETYSEVSCGKCGERAPSGEFTPYVLNPTKIVHKNGGPGMTAASYPRIRGESIRALCRSCKADLNPAHIDDVEERTVKA